MGKLWIVPIILVALVLVIDFYVIGPAVPSSLNLDAPQTLLETKLGNVLTEDGRLIESGYLKRHRKVYNEGEQQKSISHKKWDHYAVFQNDLYFSVAFADVGLASNVFITYRFKDKIETKERMLFF
jgi:hypothetical protein